MNRTFMNKVERFIVQNREAFDNENVPDSVWEKIQLPNAHQHNKRKSLLRPLYKWGIAAACTGIIFSGAYLFIQKSKHHTTYNGNPESAVSANIEKDESDTGSLQPPNEIKSTAPAHSPEVENIYKTIVAKQNELKGIASSNPELYRQFASDLATLDSSYRVLKSQANSSPNHDVIIKAMIQNLQLQAELLSRQLWIIHQFKNSKNEHYETPDNKRNI